MFKRPFQNYIGLVYLQLDTIHIHSLRAIEEVFVCCLVLSYVIWLDMQSSVFGKLLVSVSLFRETLSEQLTYGIHVYDVS